VVLQGVIFDFDGVLADTEHLHLRATQDALAARGWTLDERAYFDKYLGYGDRDLLAALAADRGAAIDDRDVEAMMRVKASRYRAHLAAGSAMYPTAAACVGRLAPRFALAIASGSLQAEIHDILVAAGLRDAFQVIVGADDCTSGKPAAEPYVKAAAQLGVEPRWAVAIEDSRWGLESARAAGLRTIGLTTSYPASALAMADLVVASLDEINVDTVARLLA
jgi:beta-phosphoglucomutase